MCCAILKDLPLVLADQRVVGRDIAAAHPFYQGYVGMLLEFSCNGWMVDMGVGCEKSF